MIYLDNAATTKTDPEVLEAMLPYLSENYGNPSGIYSLASKSRRALDAARDEHAQLLGCDPEEIFFTSGGTESDNWAVKSAALSMKSKGRHIISTKIEHHAVLRSLKELENEGFEVTYLGTDHEGYVDPLAVCRAIRPDTVLISVMYANNEIGTVEPVGEIGRIAYENGIIFHTDAVQAYGHLPVDVDACHIDMLSASAHKLYGPKGVGILYIRKGTDLPPMLKGGAQERGLRAGTENVAGIAGFGRAAGLAHKHMEERMGKETQLRNYFIGRMLSEVPDTSLNGPAVSGARLPNNVNICFRGRKAEDLLIRLDMAGVCASAGAACASGALDPSHVLMAAGLSREDAEASLRFTLGKDTTMEELDRTVEILKNM